MTFDSFLRQLFPERNPIEEVQASIKEIPKRFITAYHCGPLMEDGFSLRHVGTGEGMSALGFGVYFATQEYIAKLYCKYVERRDQVPYLYTVRLDAAGLYNGIWGTPMHLRIALSDATEELARRAGVRQLPRGSRLTHGIGSTAALFAHLGRVEAWEVLDDLGVTGAWEVLGRGDPGDLEIAVWDMSIIEVLDVVPAVDFPGFRS